MHLMKRSTKADLANAQRSLGPDTPTKRRGGKCSTEPKRKRKKIILHTNQRELLATKKSRRGSGVRETEEARALLERQLHSLYWWVFNAFKMKGFIRAKALDQLQRPANSIAEREQDDFAKAHISTKKQTP
jgi:hypothetical protein